MADAAFSVAGDVLQPAQRPVLGPTVQLTASEFTTSLRGARHQGQPSVHGVFSKSALLLATGVSLRVATRSSKKRLFKKTGMCFFGKQKEEPTEAPRKSAPKIDSKKEFIACRTKEAVKLRALGSSTTDKALQVNLNPDFYGSFAEIGAGQEVSRAFLQAGAAAGTVAKSLSAYDMQMSDALYGSAKRYVTQERLCQMMKGEYKDLEAYVRKGKAAWGGKEPEVRFFSFGASLAAKAYMSDRECEGWVGLYYQHTAGAEPSSVEMHVRMCDPTAQLQGEAIGVLGTNLIYLCSNTNDPYVITTFLQDGLADGRLEIDYINFSGPGFPEGSFDRRLLALRMVQFRISPCVMLDRDEKGNYVQVVPNDQLYKRPVIAQRGRFLPVTNTHKELMDSAERQYLEDSPEGDRAPRKLLALQVDDLMRPVELCDAVGRRDRAELLAQADSDNDGYLSFEELERLMSPNDLSEEEVKKLLASVDSDGNQTVPIDDLFGVADSTCVAESYLDRFRMLEVLENPVLVTAMNQHHELAEYLSRYTKQQVTLVVGGGGYDIKRGLYSSKIYQDSMGGVLGAFGRLFNTKRVKIFQYPNINEDGTVQEASVPEGSAGFLHQYQLAKGNIVPITAKHMSPSALDQKSNKAFCGGSYEVVASIEAGTAEWETYVPPNVAEMVKKAKWFQRVVNKEADPAAAMFSIIDTISKAQKET
eukprot:TRINITY_DN6794_c0_g1_i1.p1 TRINITY_DN6794_c0_g1~~TRINITY_DN6794_c0_g1_i1.p1  ORF type:complete len:717 (-),score=124.06 TRINITY_DN6794_c0_g1_i1:23-2128(-)